jgi:hypothetical protein
MPHFHYTENISVYILDTIASLCILMHVSLRMVVHGPNILEVLTVLGVFGWLFI